MASFNSTFLLTLLFLLLQFSEIRGHGGADDDHDSNAASGDKGDLHEKGLVLVKIWCLIIMFVTTFAGGVSPYFYRWNESFLLLGTQFAGGIFLGTALMHFLSDSTSTFEELTDKEYPFSFMLAPLAILSLCWLTVRSRTSSAGSRRRPESTSKAPAKRRRWSTTLFL